MVVEIIFIVTTIGILYGQMFFFLNLGCMSLYIIITLVVTEWRAKYFKKMVKADATYVQKATDSLLNFETVKYFNAEDHEQSRFSVALGIYKAANVKVARTLIVLNMSQTIVVVLSLVSSLVLAYMSILLGKLTISDFIVFNTYILQVYIPLGFLGTFWRFIRQNWTDVELVLDILTQDEHIKEDKYPVKANVHSGEIEFRNVCFSYDEKLPKDEQRQILYNVSFKVPAGKSVALVGSTGSGKSTIMRLLYRFYDVSEG
mmetsp:Transcript_11075/g.16833  ORF Transcript_11075/g.16833 Transcript_11075/m.16833 type:complete len:259 (+) Transcript_11075:657-1433(+)